MLTSHVKNIISDSLKITIISKNIYCISVFAPMAPKKKRFGQRAQRQPLPSSTVEDHIAALRAFVQQHKTKRKPPKPSSGKLRIFANCAGISSETIALALLGFKEQHFEFVGGTSSDACCKLFIAPSI